MSWIIKCLTGQGDGIKNLHTAGFLGAVAKLQKTTTDFVIVCLSVAVSFRETSLLQLDGFSWNFIFDYFSKICWENERLAEI